MKIRELLQKRKVQDSLIHILLFCISIWLAYSTYKIWVRSFNTIGWPNIKSSIKSTFLYAISINIIIFLYHRVIIFAKTEGKLPVKAYLSIFINLIFALNLLAFFKGSSHAMYTMNIAILYWALLLPAYNSLTIGTVNIKLGNAGNITINIESIKTIKRIIEESPLTPYVVALMGVGIVYLYLLQATKFE